MAEKPASTPWLLLKDFYQQLRAHLGPNETVQLLVALLCQWPSMPVKKRYVNSGREEILPAEDWQTEVVSLSVGVDATTGADYLEIHSTEPYRHPSLPDDPVEFLVPATNVERELDRLSSTTVAPPPEELSNKPRQKPGPKPDFKWEEIEAKFYELMDYHGEFDASDPEWDCQARAEVALMDFCQDTWGRQPAPSTLRDKLPGWLLAWRKRKTGET